jgi:hypothetical protein
MTAREGTMAADDRVRIVQEVRRMTTGQMLEWRVKRRADDSFRNSIVEWELKSRSTAAAYKAGLVGAIAGALLTWGLVHF